MNASKLFEKGRPKNYLPDENIKQISEIYLNWKEENGLSKIIKNEEAAGNDYNLSPSRYVTQDGEHETLPLVLDQKFNLPFMLLKIKIKFPAKNLNLSKKMQKKFQK